MSEKLEKLIELKEQMENSLEGPEAEVHILGINLFLAAEKYLRTKSMQESFALINTILEGDDLKRELTVIHEKMYIDMDKVFEIIGQEIPNESQKAEKMLESVEAVSKLIQETRVKKKAANA